MGLFTAFSSFKIYDQDPMSYINQGQSARMLLFVKLDLPLHNELMQKEIHIHTKSM